MKSLDILSEMSSVTLCKNVISPITPRVNPNGRVDCACTFFGRLFLHEKGVWKNQISKLISSCLLSKYLKQVYPKESIDEDQKF